MNTYLSQLLSDLRGARYTRRGATHKPDDVPRGTHKRYARMPQIPLPAPAALDLSLSEALRARSSSMKRGEVSLSLQDLGTLLGNALSVGSDGMHRPYPSGGALYPIETYLLADTLDGAPGGVYHYNPTTHALERLWDLPLKTNIASVVPRPDFIEPSALLVFTSVWTRSSAKYGDLAFLHALLEAGHMSENVLLAAAAMGLEVRPMAGFNDDMVIEALDLEIEFEQPIHSITLAKRQTV